MAGGLDTERTAHGHRIDKGVQGMNDQRNGWRDREKRKSDSTRQKMAPRNRNITQEVKPFDINVEKRLLKNQRTMGGDMDIEGKWLY